MGKRFEVQLAQGFVREQGEGAERSVRYGTLADWEQPEAFTRPCGHHFNAEVLPRD
jgi:hypothetical protein